MRASVLVALVLLNIVAVCIAGFAELDHPTSSPLKGWDEHSKLLGQPEQSKRDVKVDSEFNLELSYNNVDNGRLLSAGTTKTLSGPKLSQLKATVAFDGVKRRIGRVAPTNASIDFTATRHNNNGETYLVFDMDSNGKEILTDNVRFSTGVNAYVLDYTNIEGYGSASSVKNFYYFWVGTSTGRPAYALSSSTSVDSAYNTLTDAINNPGYAVVRVVIVKVLSDTISKCAESIDDYSLLEAACIEPRKDGKLFGSSLQVGQLFQNTPAGLASKDFEFHVRNCYGYDQKICQVASKHFVDFAGGADQLFLFDKPCRGVPSEYGCVTTVDVVLKPRKVGSTQCKAVHSKVIVPQNMRAITNKYGKAECRVVPGLEIKINAATQVADLLGNKHQQFIELEPNCEVLEGCYKINVYMDQPVLGSKLSYPVTPAQCNAMCYDGGYGYSIISDGGNRCHCIDDDQYINDGGSENSVCNAKCQNLEAGADATCGGDSSHGSVYNLRECHVTTEDTEIYWD